LLGFVGRLYVNGARLWFLLHRQQQGNLRGVFAVNDVNGLGAITTVNACRDDLSKRLWHRETTIGRPFFHVKGVGFVGRQLHQAPQSSEANFGQQHRSAKQPTETGENSDGAIHGMREPQAVEKLGAEATIVHARRDVCCRLFGLYCGCGLLRLVAAAGRNSLGIGRFVDGRVTSRFLTKGRTG